jgi:hypothetical protein
VSRVIATVRAGRPGGTDPLEPPEGEIPGVVAGERVVTRSRDVVISTGSLSVYSTGVLVTFVVRFRPGVQNRPDDVDELHRMLHGDRTPSEGRLLFGVRYPDGSMDTTVEVSDQQGASGPRLIPFSGRGRGSQWRSTYWMFPLPEDDITFFAAWPAHNVGRGTVVVTRSEVQHARDAVREAFD